MGRGPHACFVLLLLGLLLLVVWAHPALAQGAGGAEQRRSVPFFDLQRKPEKPDLTGLRAIRFLTEDDFPPFHFIGADGQLTGFNVDLARALCRELKIACTIQVRRWDTLLGALEAGAGDVVIASKKPTDEVRRRALLSVAYYRTPARFIGRQNGSSQTNTPQDATPEQLRNRRIAVVADSAHAAFLAGFFPAARPVTAVDLEEALRIFSRGDAEMVFADGIALSLFLNGERGRACCRFVGGPFYESRFFGDGAVMAIRADQAPLRRAIDYALFRLAESGEHEDLLLKYFPVRFY